jgi:hypothetical protein
MINLKQDLKEGFPTILDHGVTNEGLEYIIMNKLGFSLKYHLKKAK